MTNKLEGIQVARGIAALLVVAFHAKLILIRFPDDSYLRMPFIYEHGEVGVPLFFVISGFIISHVVQRPSFGPGNFAIKRVWRLWPLYAVCTLIYAAVYFMQRNLPPEDIGITFDAMARSLIFWPQGKYPILHPGWSLEHEVIFYIYAGLMMTLLGYRALFVFMGAVAIWGTYHWNFGSATWDWHLFARANAYFFIGMCLHAVWNWRPPRKGFICTLIGGVSVVAGMYIADEMATRASSEMVKLGTTGLGSAVFLYGLLGLRASGRAWNGFVWLGDRSYSLYLVHFSFIPIFQTIHRDLIRWPNWMAEPLCVAFVICAVLAAIAVYEIVEQPTSDRGHRAAKSFATHFAVPASSRGFVPFLLRPFVHQKTVAEVS